MVYAKERFYYSFYKDLRSLNFEIQSLEGKEEKNEDLILKICEQLGPVSKFVGRILIEFFSKIQETVDSLLFFISKGKNDKRMVNIQRKYYYCTYHFFLKMRFSQTISPKIPPKQIFYRRFKNSISFFNKKRLWIWNIIAKFMKTNY